MPPLSGTAVELICLIVAVTVAPYFDPSVRPPKRPALNVTSLRTMEYCKAPRVTVTGPVFHVSVPDCAPYQVEPPKVTPPKLPPQNGSLKLSVAVMLLFCLSSGFIVVSVVQMLKKSIFLLSPLFKENTVPAKSELTSVLTTRPGSTLLPDTVPPAIVYLTANALGIVVSVASTVAASAGGRSDF